MGIMQMFLLGLGLSADAGCVSMTNGLKESQMKIWKILLIGLFFGVFQGVMPLLGYLVGKNFMDIISRYVPYIALILLGFIGAQMLIEGIRKSKDEEDEIKELRVGSLFIQAIATSIDALTVGLIFVGTDAKEAYLAFLIIGVTTFTFSIICVFIGKKFGTIFKDKAAIIGGLILIGLGLKIFIESFI